MEFEATRLSPPTSLAAEPLLTPSKIAAWLECPHFLTLRNEVDAQLRAEPERRTDDLARLIMDKGLAHERACLEQYRAEGRSVLEVPEKDRGETFAAWCERIGNPLDGTHDVVYQLPLVHEGIRGVADFVVLDRASGIYEPVDAKLARAEAKPAHVLQLCFYAQALEHLSGRAPTSFAIFLGSGLQPEPLGARDFIPYWNRLKGQVRSALAVPPAEATTVGEPCDHCPYCEFQHDCASEWRAADSLVFTAGIRRAERQALTAAGVDTLAGLAELTGPVDGMRSARTARLTAQAQLQVEAREGVEGARPPHRPISDLEPPDWGFGYEKLPPKDDADVFLDFEGHPFWRPDRGLFFLFGLIERDLEATAEWTYRTWWADDADEEAARTAELVEHLRARRAAHSGMHVYHYNHTERSALARLVVGKGVVEAELLELAETGLFVDLLLVARNAFQVGVEGYGLKHLERLPGYERSHDIDRGAGAVVEFEAYLADHDPARRTRIERYNEDDVRATLALRDWLLDHRDDDHAWRDAWLEPPESPQELDERVRALHQFPEDSPEHLFGHVLGYWRREWLAFLGPKLTKCSADDDKQLDDPEVICLLESIGLEERLGKKGTPITPLMRLRFPTQALGDFAVGRVPKVLFPFEEGGAAFASVLEVDPGAGTLGLAWDPKLQERGEVPTSVVANDWVAPKPKPEALSAIADRLIDPATHGELSRLAMALLRRELPRFLPGHGPSGGRFTDDIDDICGWVAHLDESFVAVQGPPGTGKTFAGAHLIRSLLQVGKRVGVTAQSHQAIANLLAELNDVLARHDDVDLLRGVRRVRSTKIAEGFTNVKNTENNKVCAKEDFNLVAGTTWLFAGDDMAGAQVDVLVVDEAGQLALADALAASRAARNMVLLGDPLQLAQVTMASHPPGGGSSVLEHVLGDDQTMPDDRGVFLAETRRMHPDVCEFISTQIYGGRLGSHESCARQGTTSGTGLRLLHAEHQTRSTESPEEAELVAEEITRLLAGRWTDNRAIDRDLTADQVMVVAPYNDQVRLIRERFAQDPALADVRVGTVDKFQGGQAAVVFFTMTTSTAAEMVRSPDFLFSRNRLNVAISRARCLAYLVCTEELLNSRAKTVEQMRLIATLCAFAEHAEAP